MVGVAFFSASINTLTKIHGDRAINMDTAADQEKFNRIIQLLGQVEAVWMDELKPLPRPRKRHGDEHHHPRRPAERAVRPL